MSHSQVLEIAGFKSLTKFLSLLFNNPPSKTQWPGEGLLVTCQFKTSDVSVFRADSFSLNSTVEFLTAEELQPSADLIVYESIWTGRQAGAERAVRRSEAQMGF